MKDVLIAEGRTRWLDIGCGGNFDEAFQYLDLFPEGLIPIPHRQSYTRLDIVKAPQQSLSRLGTFDLIRMQHLLEHLTWEDASAALTNCASLLSPEGILLITVPNLEVHVARYIQGTYQADLGYAGWAQQRIPSDAPDSCYFSLFAHSMTYEPHLWCYDQAGLEYKVTSTGAFQTQFVLPKDSPLAETPFTHNRPDEDLCLIAIR